MKRYIRTSIENTLSYDERLGERFIAYCKNANCKNARISGVNDRDIKFKFVTGVPLSRLDTLVDQFSKKLEEDGTPIIFELSNERGWPHKIIRLESKTVPK